MELRNNCLLKGVRVRVSVQESKEVVVHWPGDVRSGLGLGLGMGMITTMTYLRMTYL